MSSGLCLFMSKSFRLALAAGAALCVLPAFSPAFAGTDDDQRAAVDSVLVTARPNPEDAPVVALARKRLSETPGAVAVISSEAYANRYALGLVDALRDVPGVFAQKKFGEDARLSIRGSGIGNSSHNRGTMLAQDGVPLNEADGYGDYQLIDPLLARYTEVYKGGNALRFGGALLGGAINFVTPTGRTAGADNLLRVEGGSFGTARVHGELARAFGDDDVFIGATLLNADGWRRQSNSSAARLSVNLGHDFGEDREVRLYLSGADLRQQIAGALTLNQALNSPMMATAANLANNYGRNMRNARASLQTTWRLSDSTVFEGGVYGAWRDLDHPIFQVVDQESRNFGAFGRLDWTGQMGGMAADLFAGLSWRVGDLDSRNWINLRGSHGAPTAFARQNAQAADVFAEGRLFVAPRLALVVGGTYGAASRDYQSYKLPTGGFNLTESRDYDWFAPRLGVLFQADQDSQIFANLTRSVEPPNFGSYSPDATHPFTDLVPQTAWTGEVGARGRRGAFAWDVALYRAQLKHELLSYVVDPARPAIAFNADKTIHQGLEAGLDWRIVPRLRLRQTYAWSDFRFDGDASYKDNRLPVVPEHLYRAELRYEHPAGWFVAPSVEWSPRGVLVDYRNTVRAPDYAIASLSAGYTRDRITVFLDARNLTDERYVSTINPSVAATTVSTSTTVDNSTAAFWPGEGRGVFVGLTGKF
ncbi:TonB-dependent receptor [Caulobacter sp. Root655]|nr:TonB-dependent receptor [Caulobacter sp. Root655]